MAIDFATVIRSGSTPRCSTAKNVPGAAEPALHLVADEHDAVLVAGLAQPLGELQRRGNEAAFALNRLEHDRGHVFGGDERRERARRTAARAGYVVGHAVDLGGERAESGLVGVRLRRQGERQVRPAVERALEADHRRAAGVGASELDGVLDRLRAGVEERRLRRARERGEREQALRELGVDLVGDDREVGVREAIELLLRRLTTGGWE